METLVLVMMILVCFSFVLKQTFHGVKEIMIISVLVAFFVGMTWPFAIEQSKTQIPPVPSRSGRSGGPCGGGYFEAWPAAGCPSTGPSP